MPVTSYARPRWIGTCAIAVALLTSAPGCERSHRVGLRISVPDGVSPATLELRVYEQSTCVDGATVGTVAPSRDDSIHHQVFSPQEGGTEVGELGGGERAFAVLGRDGSCDPVLFGCETARLSSTDAVRIELDPYTPPAGAPCGAGRRCVGEGVCGAGAPMDAGSDAQPSEDAGVDAGMPPEVTQLASGAAHTCALRADGHVLCWGNDRYGNLGTGEVSGASPDPRLVTTDDGATLSGVTRIAAGTQHTCASTGERVFCWGRNADGAFGFSSSDTESATPRAVPVPPDAYSFLAETGVEGDLHLAAGAHHTCLALRSRIACFGRNDLDQLGVGSGGVEGATELGDEAGAVTDLVAGNAFTCAFTETRSVYCWGDNGRGQLSAGAGSASSRATAEPIELEESATAELADGVAGAFHACAVALEADGDSGDTYCWGANTHGQIGADMAGEDVTVAQLVETSSYDAVPAAAGWHHTCFISTLLAGSGRAVCVGRNDDGQLGDGTRTSRSEVADPGYLVELEGVEAVVAGEAHTCALASSGVWCWGRNDDGQLGPAAPDDGSATPVQVTGLDAPAP